MVMVINATFNNIEVISSKIDKGATIYKSGSDLKKKKSFIVKIN